MKNRFPISNFQFPIAHSPNRHSALGNRQFPRLLFALSISAALSLPHSSSRAEDEPIPANVQSAVDRGLDWLSKNQERDGSWSAGGGSRGARSAAVTGLAVMAFMARGHVPGQGPYGENLNKGIDYLLSLQQSDGILASSSLSQPMYDHGICSVALCEAYGMLDDRRQGLARTAIAHAIRKILDAQAVSKAAENQGGWRYQPNSADSDLSVTGWQLMALRGAANVGADVPPAAIAAGIAYVKRRRAADGSFCYTGNAGGNVALTGTGVLALCLLGQPEAPEVKTGGDYLLRTSVVTRQDHYFYTVYYCSQAAFQLGGKYWSDIGKQISDDLRSKQRPDGSWPIIGGSDSQGGETYCTSMAILALTVPYRYLPIYQR